MLCTRLEAGLAGQCLRGREHRGTRHRSVRPLFIQLPTRHQSIQTNAYTGAQATTNKGTRRYYLYLNLNSRYTGPRHLLGKCNILDGSQGRLQIPLITSLPALCQDAMISVQAAKPVHVRQIQNTTGQGTYQLRGSSFFPGTLFPQ